MTTTAIALFLGIAVIAWDALQPVPPTAASPAVVVRPFDPARIAAVLRHPVYTTLVPLAPPVRPTTIGNAHPFHGAPEPSLPR